MPQLSLYIDQKTLKKIEIAAKLEHLSVSKYVVRKLNETMNKSWPENYPNLFGSISDDTFNVEGPKDFSDDVPREVL